MPSRSKLIADYLRLHDPLAPTSDAAPGHHAAQSRTDARRAPRSPWPRRTALGGGLAAAACLAIALLIGGAFIGGDADHHRDPIARFLSPEQAIAAVNHDLSSGSILHWILHSRSSGGHDSGGTVSFESRSDTWFDLTTGAMHGTLSNQKISNGKTLPGAGISPETWSDGKQTHWALCPRSLCPQPDGRRQVNKTINFAIVGKHAGHYSPLADVQAQLGRALAGKAAMQDVGNYHGIPVVKVIEHTRLGGGDPKRQMSASSSTWIVRAPRPWLLRYRLDVRTRSGRLIHRGETVTDTWAFYDRTPAALAQITPPVFDPSKYRVIVQHLGPGSGKYKKADRATTK